MEYLDGEGTVESRAAIAGHLVGCGTCRAAAAEQRGLTESARTWDVAPAPSSLRLPPAQPAKLLFRAGAWRRSRVVMAGLTAAAAMLVLIPFTARQKRALSEPTSTMTASMQSADKPDTIDRAAGQAADGSGLRRLSTRAVEQSPASVAPPREPSVIRTATLRIVAKEFGGVRAAVEGIVSQNGGFIDQMTITGDTSTARALRGTLRVPGARLPDTLVRLRQIGQVVEDTQGSQDVTDQIVDLDARLASARATEQRLTDLLRNRTGKLSDVLDVERELARVRLDIERLDAEKTNVGRRVSYAAIDIHIAEERKAGLDTGPLSLATRTRIAAADGLAAAMESVAWTLLFLLRAGPSLLLWGVVVALVWVFGRRFMKPSA